MPYKLNIPQYKEFADDLANDVAEIKNGKYNDSTGRQVIAGRKNQLKLLDLAIQFERITKGMRQDDGQA